jgi:hypothetical protein
MATIGRGTKMKVICENPQAAAIVDKYVPGLTTSPSIEQAYALPLKLTISFKEVGCSKEDQKACILELEAAAIEA